MKGRAVHLLIVRTLVVLLLACGATPSSISYAKKATSAATQVAPKKKKATSKKKIMRAKPHKRPTSAKMKAVKKSSKKPAKATGAVAASSKRKLTTKTRSKKTASTSPWLFLFVSFAAGLAGFYFWKKRLEHQNLGQEESDHTLKDHHKLSIFATRITSSPQPFSISAFAAFASDLELPQQALDGTGSAAKSANTVKMSENARSRPKKSRAG